MVGFHSPKAPKEKGVRANTLQNQQNGMCAQPRLRSAWASTQSDHSLCCAINGYLRTKAFLMWTEKTDQTGQAQADLSLRWGHMSFCWFCHVLADMKNKYFFLFLHQNISCGYSLEFPQPISTHKVSLFAPNHSEAIS